MVLLFVLVFLWFCCGGLVVVVCVLICACGGLVLRCVYRLSWLSFIRWLTYLRWQISLLLMCVCGSYLQTPKTLSLLMSKGEQLSIFVFVVVISLVVCVFVKIVFNQLKTVTAYE